MSIQANHVSVEETVGLWDVVWLTREVPFPNQKLIPVLTIGILTMLPNMYVACHYMYLNWEWDFVCIHCLNHNLPQNIAVLLALTPEVPMEP